MTAETFDEAYIPDLVPEDDIRYFEKSHYGGRLGWGERPAVLVVDMTNQFVSEEYPLGRGDAGSRAVEANERLLERARDVDVPIVYTRGPGKRVNLPAYRAILDENRTQESVYDPGEGNTIVQELEPRKEDIVVEKPRASAFFDTHVGNILRSQGIDTLVVTGMTTSGCVRASVVDAFSSNMRPIVPVECVADRSEVSHEVSLFDMDMKYADVGLLDEVLATIGTF